MGSTRKPSPKKTTSSVKGVAAKSDRRNSNGSYQTTPTPKEKVFHLEFKSATQKMAWASFQQSHLMFLLGPAGTGKTYLAMAFAINEILAGRKSKIIITRPIVEAGESLGFLPGSADEKVSPYMTPLFDSLTKLVGAPGSRQRQIIDECIEVRPLAYMRGSTFDDSIAILDEAQNCTKAQLIMFITRIGENTKLIINGDPYQSDLPGEPYLVELMDRLDDVPEIGQVEFTDEEIIRHPIISKILKRL